MQMVVSGEISSLTNVDVFCKNILVWEPVLQQVLLHCPTALGARNLKCTILGFPIKSNLSSLHLAIIISLQ